MIGMSYGAIIMGSFGCLWLGWGLAAMNLRAAMIVAAVIAFGASLWIPAGVLLRKSSRALKNAAPLTPAERREQSRMGRMFGLIFGAEGLLIFLAVNVLNNIGLRDYGVSAIAAIVGLHFLPLARLYRRPMYTVVGILMTVAALLSIALPSPIRISVLATTMAAIVWVTCILVVRSGFAMGQEMQTEGT